MFDIYEKHQEAFKANNIFKSLIEEVISEKPKDAYSSSSSNPPKRTTFTNSRKNSYEKPDSPTQENNFHVQSSIALNETDKIIIPKNNPLQEMMNSNK